MLSLLLDALFPKKSLSGGEGEWITATERLKLQSFPIVETAQQLRTHGIRHLDRLVAGSDYRQCPFLKKAIWTFKFRRILALGEELGRLMFLSKDAALRASALRHGSRQAQLSMTRCVLVPVPLHWTRRFWRGFNQSEILARILSEKCCIPVQASLKRIRPTGFQSHRARKERLTALAGAFRVTGPAPERVILIDDIATTGATLDACAEELKKSGARWVEGWVVARG